MSLITTLYFYLFCFLLLHMIYHGGSICQKSPTSNTDKRRENLCYQPTIHSVVTGESLLQAFLLSPSYNDFCGLPSDPLMRKGEDRTTEYHKK